MKGKIKRVITIGGAAMMLLGMILPAQSKAYAAEQEYEKYIVPGVIVTDVEKNAPAAKDSPQDIKVYGSLESKYPANPEDLLKNFPKIRNQSTGIKGESGTCWAHAAIATAEFYTKIKNKTIADYSELALAYNTYATQNDPLEGLKGDTNGLKSDSNFLSYGGTGYYAFITLFKRFGVSNEKVAPYTSEGIKKIKSKGMTMSEATNNAIHLKDFSIINVKGSSRDRIKEEIKDKGSVFAYMNSNETYYNSKTNSHYCYNTGNVDHAIAIVGWDDNYSASKFNKKPQGNGAWLVRNSWGDNKFSRYGYFWMSYYDTAFSGELPVVLSAEYTTKNDFDNNYQYDGAITDIDIAGKKVTGANIYKAHSGTKKEYLKSVAVGVGSANTNYKIEIYKGVDKTNPCSGKKVAEATTIGEFKYPGMHTVQLNASVELEKNQLFSVVITLEGKTGNGMLKAEVSRNSGIVTKASLEKNQSYYKIDNGSWKDLYGTGRGNLRIKAYTDNVITEDPPIGWYYNTSLKAMQYYDKPGVYVKGWKWMDESTKETTPHFSFFNLKNGALYTGWHEMGTAEGEKTKHTSYFGSNGWLRTGWKWMDEKEGQKTPHWSYFGSNGWLRTGWVQMGKGTSEPDNNNEKHWSYFDSKGWLVTNCTLKINGNNYTFDDRGWLISEPFGLSGGRSDAKIPAGWYTINAFGNKKYCLDVSGASASNGANIILYQANKTKAQKFYVEPKGNGVYRILTGTNNKKSTMDITGNGKISGTNVAQYVANNTDAQLWRILKNPDGSVGIVAVNSGLALDIEGNMYKNGSNITIYKMNSTKAQKFSFNKA